MPLGHAARSPHRVHLVLATSIVVALVGAVVVGVATTSRPARPRFAYLTSRELVVASTDGVVGRIPGVPATGGNATTTTWTSDGRFAVIVAEGPGGPDDGAHRTLAVVGADGVARTRPCPGCTTVVALGGSTVLASQADVSAATVAEAAPPLGFLRFDLASGRPADALPLSVPAGVVNRLFLVAGVPGQAFAVTESAHDDSETADTVGADGTMTPMATYREIFPRGSNQRGVGTAAAHSDPTGSMVAVSGQYRDSRRPDCSTSAEVHLYHPGADAIPTDFGAAAPPGRRVGTDANTAVTDLWWAPDGRLRALLGVAPCGPADGHPTSALSRWVLDGRRWSPDGPAGGLADRMLSDGTEVVLRPVPDSGADTGDIVVVHDGRERVLDHDVQSYSLSLAS